jgi:hypothetical protein
MPLPPFLLFLSVYTVKVEGEGVQTLICVGKAVEICVV